MPVLQAFISLNIRQIEADHISSEDLILLCLPPPRLGSDIGFGSGLFWGPRWICGDDQSDDTVSASFRDQDRTSSDYPIRRHYQISVLCHSLPNDSAYKDALPTVSMPKVQREDLKTVKGMTELITEILKISGHE